MSRQPFIWKPGRSNLYQTTGRIPQSHKVCMEIEESLYGLKQSPRCWNERLVTFMNEKGFKKSTADP